MLESGNLLSEFVCTFILQQHIMSTSTTQPRSAKDIEFKVDPDAPLFVAGAVLVSGEYECELLHEERRPRPPSSTYASTP
jgi:glycerol uptake facilitator-like aquaporin